MCLYLCFHSAIFKLVCLGVWSPVSLFTHPANYLYMSVCVFIYLFTVFILLLIYLAVCLFVCLSVNLFIYLPIRITISFTTLLHTLIRHYFFQHPRHCVYCLPPSCRKVCNSQAFSARAIISIVAAADFSSCHFPFSLRGIHPSAAAGVYIWPSLVAC